MTVINHENELPIRQWKSEADPEHYLIREISAEMLINGQRVGSVSCTPRDLEELAAGWLLTEGFINDVTQIESVEFSDEEKSIDVKVEAQVEEKTEAKVEVQVEAKEEMTEDAKVEVTDPCANLKKREQAEELEVPPVWTDEDLRQVFQLQTEDPPLFALTHAAHSCMILRHTVPPSVEENPGLEVLFRSEDAGRHSALDKAIGWALFHGVNLRDCLLMTSGRISTRMAEKAGRAGAGALAGKGSVTAEAVELARKHDMELIGYVQANSAVRFWAERQ